MSALFSVSGKRKFLKNKKEANAQRLEFRERGQASGLDAWPAAGRGGGFALCSVRGSHGWV